MNKLFSIKVAFFFNNLLAKKNDLKDSWQRYKKTGA